METVHFSEQKTSDIFPCKLEAIVFEIDGL